MIAHDSSTMHTKSCKYNHIKIVIITTVI